MLILKALKFELFKYLSELLGIIWSDQVLSLPPERLGHNHFDEIDLVSLEPVVKHIPIVSLSQGYMLKTKARQYDGRERVSYAARAVAEFNKALDSNFYLDRSSHFADPKTSFYRKPVLLPLWGAPMPPKPYSLPLPSKRRTTPRSLSHME